MLCVIQKKEKAFLGKRKYLKKINLGSVSYPGENREISFDLIKRIRHMCSLSEGDGIDSSVFYDNESIIDSFVNKYRTILRRLANK